MMWAMVPQGKIADSAPVARQIMKEVTKMNMSLHGDTYLKQKEAFAHRSTNISISLHSATSSAGPRVEHREAGDAS